MFWKKKPESSPLGVRLGDLAKLLGSGKVKTAFEGNALLVSHQHYTTRVEVVPPEPGAVKDEPIKAVVRVVSELPAPLTEVLLADSGEAAVQFNSMAALGAITLDDGSLYIGSRLTIFEREDAWTRLHLPLLFFAVIGGPMAIAGAIRRTLTEELESSQVSAWQSREFDALSARMSRFCSCASGDSRFTAEFNLASRGSPAIAGRPQTALFQLSAEEPHPELGGGLLIVLHLSHLFATNDAVQRACSRLNLLEMAAADLPPHFGAWGPGRVDGTIAYVTFFPNALHVVDGLAMNATMWAFHRSEWATKKLTEMGYRL